MVRYNCWLFRKEQKYANQICLSWCSTECHRLKIFACGKRGKGIITKDEISEDIVKTIRQIIKEQLYLSSRLLKNLSKEDKAMSGFSVDGYVELTGSM